MLWQAPSAEVAQCGSGIVAQQIPAIEVTNNLTSDDCSDILRIVSSCEKLSILDFEIGQ